MALDTIGQDPGSQAAANISKVIEAMANAKQAQNELQKQVLLSRIGMKMDLQKKAAEQQIEVQRPIQQLEAWNHFSGQNPQTGLDGLSSLGRATNATPDQIGTVPQLPGKPIQQTPPMSMADPSKQPYNDAASQLTMPKVSSPVVPQGQPPMSRIAPQPSVQYTNLGYQPIEANQLSAYRRKNGQTINIGDVAYVGALKNVKNGTANPDQIALVNKMNGRDENGKLLVNPSSSMIPSRNSTGNNMQTILSNVENDYRSMGMDLPKGSMWINPATGTPEISPIYMKQVEALNTAKAHYLVEQPWRDQETAQQFNKALDPSYYRAGAFGDSKKIFDRGERLQSLYNASTIQSGGLDQRQIEEITIGYQNMLSGGMGSVMEVNALLPKTIVGDGNKLSEWLTNNPTGTDQIKFVDRIHSGIKREMDTVQSQMNRTRYQRIATFEPWIQRNPDQAREMMMSYGVNPEGYQKWREHGYKQQSAIQQPKSETTMPSESDIEYTLKLHPEYTRESLLKKLGVSNAN